MKFILFLLILFSVTIYAQTDLNRWGKADISYQKKSIIKERENSTDNAGMADIIITAMAKAYWIFISDVDGDNCAFSPSCSLFFIRSVEETNIVQGTLMFADRLTRDTNFFDRVYRYPLAGNGKLYDIPSNYKLDSSEIKYIPPYASVNDE